MDYACTLGLPQTSCCLHYVEASEVSLKTTLIYIDLEKAIFKNTNDDFTVRVADNLDEACELLEVGFKYVCDMKGKKIFRKRK